MLAGKHITFVGDSIMAQQANSLVALLSVPNTAESTNFACNPLQQEVKWRHAPDTTLKGFEGMLYFVTHYLNRTETFCGGSVAVTYIRNDVLAFHETKEYRYGGPEGMPPSAAGTRPPEWPPVFEHKKRNFHNLPYWDVVSKSDVVVFNKGAHTYDKAKRHRSLQLGAQAAVLKRPMFVWRTTGNAHSKCWNATKPRQGASADGITPTNPEGNPEYGWSGFGYEGEVAVAALEYAAPGRFQYLDAYGLTLRRIDHHSNGGGRGDASRGQEGTDCLHWCLPGPPDEWNYYLVDMIRRHFNN